MSKIFFKKYFDTNYKPFKICFVAVARKTVPVVRRTKSGTKLMKEQIKDVLFECGTDGKMSLPIFMVRFGEMFPETQAFSETELRDEFSDIIKINSKQKTIERIKSYSEKQRHQRYRDVAKVCRSGTNNAIISASARVFYMRNERDSGYVVKQLRDDHVKTGRIIKSLATFII